MAAPPPHSPGLDNQTPRQAAAENPIIIPQPSLNGTHPAKVEADLSATLSTGYKPNLPIYYFREEYFNPFSFYLDLEAMLRHDSVLMPLANVKSAAAQAQISVDASSSTVAKFVIAEWERFKQGYLVKVQDNSYPYGWMGAEVVYDVEQGKRVQSGFKDFASRDVQPLVRDGSVVGVQVRNVPTGTLWLSGSDRGIPAKGFWYAHQAVNGRHYGISQIQGAWKPWRRLTGRDGVEEQEDIATYRYATGTVVIGFPPEDTKATNQAPSYSSSGRTSSQQRALEMGENIKAGGNIALPTSTYPNTNNPKWTYTVEAAQTNIGELLEFDEALYKKISKAIGWSPELSEASETGSGYSGRQIPLEAFLNTQQSVAQSIVQAWFEQICRPLIWWNFGKRAWARVTVVSLLDTYRKQGTPQAAQPQPDAAQQTSAGPEQAEPDAQGHVPYKGPRGGSGWKDAQGRIHYSTGSSKAPKQLSTFATYTSESFDVASQAVHTGLEGGSDKEAIGKLAERIAELDADELSELEAEIEGNE